jgi:SAM-dependent methyltransferase
VTQEAGSGVSPRFLTLLSEEDLRRQRVLDVGCGWGRLTLWLASRVRHAVGLDRDTALIADARCRAKEARLARVEFHEADVESVEYTPWAPDLVTAHLCASDAIVERAARALVRGSCLGLVAIHVGQWRETGTVSRFAYDEPRMKAVLHASGFEPEVVEVEQSVQRFASVAEALAAALPHEARWKSDGRWFRYVEFLEHGGRTLTRSHLIVKARRA